MRLSPTLRSVTVSYGPPPPNQDPTFDQDLLDQTDAEGDLISLDAGATDPDGDTLTYAASGLPAGLPHRHRHRPDQRHHRLQRRRRQPLQRSSVTVSDGAAVDATDTFSWTVTNTNQDPTFDQDLPDQTDAEGDRHQPRCRRHRPRRRHPDLRRQRPAGRPVASTPPPA